MACRTTSLWFLLHASWAKNGTHLGWIPRGDREDILAFKTGYSGTRPQRCTLKKRGGEGRGARLLAAVRAGRRTCQASWPATPQQIATNATFQPSLRRSFFGPYWPAVVRRSQSRDAVPGQVMWRGLPSTGPGLLGCVAMVTSQGTQNWPARRLCDDSSPCVRARFASRQADTAPLRRTAFLRSRTEGWEPQPTCFWANELSRMCVCVVWGGGLALW